MAALRSSTILCFLQNISGILRVQLLLFVRRSLEIEHIITLNQFVLIEGIYQSRLKIFRKVPVGGRI
jgi:hypothetical protein